MKIAAYCRVSTEKEAQIDSLEKQIEFFNEFTKKNGLKNRYVIPESIEIKGVFLSTKNPVVRLGMIIKYIRKFHLKCNKNFLTNILTVCCSLSYY